MVVVIAVVEHPDQSAPGIERGVGYRHRLLPPEPFGDSATGWKVVLGRQPITGERTQVKNRTVRIHDAEARDTVVRLRLLEPFDRLQLGLSLIHI